MENTTDFSAYTLSFQKKKKNKRTEYKRQFTIISIKKTTFFILGYIKKRTIKKETEFTRRIKK